jgi:D-3-phosphoglycerate dehydrogenase
MAGHILGTSPSLKGHVSLMPTACSSTIGDLPAVLFLEDHMEGSIPKDDIVSAFATHDFKVVWSDDGEPPQDIVAIVTVKKKVDAAMLEKFPALKFVAVCFTGYDHVDLDACASRGIAVANVPGYSTHGVAELCFGLIFALLRHIPRAHSHIRDNKWNWPPGNELSGKRIGLIGTGKIGMRIAEIAKAFNVSKVLGWDKFQNPEFSERLGGEYVASLATLFLHADVICVAVALTKDTRGLVTEKLLKLLRPESILINCARGAIIDQTALVDMLTEGRFRAGLDVYEIEPLAPDHAIRKVPETHLVSTPHLAYKCEESLLRRHDVTLANILAFFSDSPQNIVS